MIKVEYKEVQDNTTYKCTIYYNSKEDYEKYINDCKELDYKSDLKYFYNMTEEEADQYYKNRHECI